MLRLAGRTHYFLLTREPDLKSHTLSIYGRFDEALSRWHSGARISPVFPTQDSPAPTLSAGQRSWILFLGPLHPGEVELTSGQEVLVSLGLFNIIIISQTEPQRREAREFAESRKVHWEEWSLDGCQVTSYELASFDNQSLPTGLLKTISGLQKALEPTAREYVTIIATTVARAMSFAPQAAPDLVAFDKQFRALVSDVQLNDVKRQGLLVNANAVLSRYSSQTYAGTSPIFETECHFWTHSLLGIGIPSIALLRLRQFVSRALSETQFQQRFLALKRQPATPNSLLLLSPSDPFWEKDHLWPDDTQVPDGDPPTIPIITCFSGRDGFKSTQLSLSAPLEVITGCNTTEWTLLTLTHEISHILIDGVLATLIPEDSNALARIIEHHRIDNFLDRLTEMLCWSYWALEGKTEGVLNASELSKLITARTLEVNEILTHVFDFLYFYQSNSSNYIRSIWASWAVIPNIQNRIPSYIVRSLCALYANHLRRRNAIDVTIEELSNCLQAAKADFPSALYITEALVLLSERRSEFAKELTLRGPFTRFVRYILFSHKIAARLIADPDVAGGDKDGYAFTVGEFMAERIKNPLRFLEAFSKDKALSPIRSLWILQQLACMVYS